MKLSKNGHIVYEIESCDIVDGVLTFPETVTFISFNLKFSADKNLIKKLVLPNVKVISSKTFIGLKVVEIEAPKLVKISNEAFLNCSELEVVKTPVLQTIGDRAFKGCFNLKYIDLVNIKEIGSKAFEYSDNLQVLGNLGYTKIGFTAEQSNHLILKLARKIRQANGLESEDNSNNFLTDYSRKVIIANPNYKNSTTI